MKILSLASKLSLQSPMLVDKFKSDEIMVISPLDDSINAKFIKCEIGAMSYALALIGLEFGFDGKFWNELDEGELISVLERTKEIGILRAIGASKRDISRVFNAETLIVGFTSG
ncbi:MAG: hypothetical protein IJ953_08050, partial [Campylobacter sp.]|nr:hypothetical protein [Campylobacter sp.]